MSFSLRRKPKRSDIVTQFGCADIYSTLSKKPAGNQFRNCAHIMFHCVAVFTFLFVCLFVCLFVRFVCSSVLLLADLKTTDIDLSALRVFLGYVHANIV